VTRTIRKVLVANRGEIARRVFRTCRERGIGTVAVYSEPDVDALHVAEADEAVLIGPAPATASYLDVDRILEAARATQADAIHPGYGFLSERAHFANACDAAGIAFIGPPGSAMEVMGDKESARAAMRAAGVPVVPGQDGIATASEAEAAAASIGFPVMIKASAGGGGKGMRIVSEPARVVPSFEAARREALASFGDGRIFMERAILGARHVEIQVLADAHGNVVHLGERDCSVQRRHQKVIEESPSPSPQMTPDVRAAMGAVAVKAAAAVGYRSAGTVEFLFEETPNGPRFYFLEMNTRLQVEHPVTELVTGRDLVWDQIRVAAGEPLGFSQADVRIHGHAIECRIYAEDPITFLPRPGTLRVVRWPEGGGIRVDAAVTAGSVVSTHYDPMIAKLAVHGADRAEAIGRMRRALRDTVLLGIETNVGLHRRIFDEPDFASGHAVTTRYIETHPAVTAPAEEIPAGWSASIAAAAAAAALTARSAHAPDDSARDRQNSLSAWRLSASWRS
jgi:acetyl-CoA carboxylase biotin carboxylase subunit